MIVETQTRSAMAPPETFPSTRAPRHRATATPGQSASGQATRTAPVPLAASIGGRRKRGGSAGGPRSERGSTTVSWGEGGDVTTTAGATAAGNSAGTITAWGPAQARRHTAAI